MSSTHAEVDEGPVSLTAGIDLLDRFTRAAHLREIAVFDLVTVLADLNRTGVIERLEGLPVDVLLAVQHGWTSAERTMLLDAGDVLACMPATWQLWQIRVISWSIVRDIVAQVRRYGRDLRTGVDERLAASAELLTDLDPEQISWAVADAIEELRGVKAKTQVEQRDVNESFVALQMNLDGGCRLYGHLNAPDTAIVTNALDSRTAKAKAAKAKAAEADSTRTNAHDTDHGPATPDDAQANDDADDLTGEDLADFDPTAADYPAADYPAADDPAEDDPTDANWPDPGSVGAGPSDQAGGWNPDESWPGDPSPTAGQPRPDQQPGPAAGQPRRKRRRSRAKDRARALVGLCRDSLASHSCTGTTIPARPLMVVHVPLDRITATCSGLLELAIPNGLPRLSAALVDNIAGDADLQAVIFHGKRPLHTTARITANSVSAAARLAVQARDLGGRDPAATTTIALSDIHHLSPGVHDPDQMVCVSPRGHHRMLHRHGWTGQIRPDAAVEWTRNGQTITTRPRGTPLGRPD